jgi:hypothetical protein
MRRALFVPLAKHDEGGQIKVDMMGWAWGMHGEKINVWRKH